MQDICQCPQCESTDVDFLPRRNKYVCVKCGQIFAAERPSAALRIFLSYGHDQQASLASLIHQDLEHRGHKVWIDKKGIRPGDDWESSIENGLAWVQEVGASGRFILLMTPHSVRRPDGFCLRELARAIERRIPIVPIMVKWSEPPLSICHLQWLDMRDCVPVERKGNNYTQRLQQLITALENPHMELQGTSSRLRTILEPMPFGADISTHLKHFTGRVWIVTAIGKWLDAPKASRVFWITGDPGTGKTALSCWLCCNHPSIKAFHLCNATTGGDGLNEKADPRWVIRSLAYQLSALIPEYQERLGNLNLERIVKEDSAQSMFDRLLTDSLHGIKLGNDEKIVILIDGLDEATDSQGRNELAQFIRHQFFKTPKWLRIIITSRYQKPITSELESIVEPFHMRSQIHKAENENDLREFFIREFSKDTEDGTMDKGTIDVLLKQCDGNFLYAEHVRREIMSGNLSLSNPEDFPKGLSGIYRSFFQRQFNGQDWYDAHIRDKLEIILAAQSPLLLEEAKDFFHWDRGHELMRFKRQLGALFSFENDRIQPFHKSLTEWLTNEEDVDRYADEYHIDVQIGHDSLAEIGWNAYLGAKNTDPSELSPAQKKSLAELPHHLLNTNKIKRVVEYLADMATFIRLFRDNRFGFIGYLNAVDRKCDAVQSKRINWVQIFSEKLTQLGSGSCEQDEAVVAHHYCGVLFFTMSEYLAAVQPLRRALDFLKESDKDLTRASLLNDLGETYRNIGKLEDAQNYYEQALSIRRRELADHDPDLAESINNYGHIFLHKREFDKMETLYEEALEKRKSMYGESHFKIAESYNNLAFVWEGKEEYEKAEDYLERAIDIMEKDYEWHPDLALFKRNLALLKKRRGIFPEVEELFKSAWDVRKRLLGPEHRETLSSGAELVKWYQSRGNRDRAISICEELAETCERIIIYSDRQSIEALKKFPYEFLAEAYAEKKVYEKSLEMYEKLKQIYIAESGEESEAIFTIMNTVAFNQRVAGEIATAISLYREIVARGEKIIESLESPPEPSDKRVFYTSVAYNEIAFHKHVPEADWKAADKYYTRAIAIMKTLKDDTELANMYLNQQMVYHLSGRGADLSEVRRLTDILERDKDGRAEKGKKILREAEAD